MKEAEKCARTRNLRRLGEQYECGFASARYGSENAGEKLGTSPAYISVIIYGKRTSPKMVMRICETLDMPIKVKWLKEA